jgi:lipoate synthase
MTNSTRVYSSVEDYNSYSYADIHVNLYVATKDEAIDVEVENVTQAIENNINQYNALVDSLNDTLNVGKDIYNNNVEIVNDINNIIHNTKSTFNTLTNLLNNASKLFTFE